MARVEGHLLDTLGRLEAACVPVRGVHGFTCHLIQSGREGLVVRLGLGTLDAFDVALVGMLKRLADNDDALRTRHLILR